MMDDIVPWEFGLTSTDVFVSVSLTRRLLDVLISSCSWVIDSIPCCWVYNHDEPRGRLLCGTVMLNRILLSVETRLDNAIRASRYGRYFFVEL